MGAMRGRMTTVQCSNENKKTRAPDYGVYIHDQCRMVVCVCVTKAAWNEVRCVLTIITSFTVQRARLSVPVPTQQCRHPSIPSASMTHGNSLVAVRRPWGQSRCLQAPLRAHHVPMVVVSHPRTISVRMCVSVLSDLVPVVLGVYRVCVARDGMQTHRLGGRRRMRCSDSWFVIRLAIEVRLSVARVGNCV